MEVPLYYNDVARTRGMTSNDPYAGCGVCGGVKRQVYKDSRHSVMGHYLQSVCVDGRGVSVMAYARFLNVRVFFALVPKEHRKGVDHQREVRTACVVTLLYCSSKDGATSEHVRPASDK